MIRPGERALSRSQKVNPIAHTAQFWAHAQTQSRFRNVGLVGCVDSVMLVTWSLQQYDWLSSQSASAFWLAELGADGNWPFLLNQCPSDMNQICEMNFVISTRFLDNIWANFGRHEEVKWRKLESLLQIYMYLGCTKTLSSVIDPEGVQNKTAN